MKMVKGLAMSSNVKIGALVNFSVKKSKLAWHLSVHLNLLDFFNNFVSGVNNF